MNSLEQERKQLRAMVELGAPGLIDLGDHVAELIDPALVEQTMAATAEVSKSRRAYEATTTENKIEAKPQAIVAYVLAGIFRCFQGHRCDHVAMADTPCYALLAPRILTCPRCLPEMLPKIAAQDRRVRDGEDNLCDFCLIEPVDNQFYRMVSLQYGPAVVAGDMCEECMARFKA